MDVKELESMCANLQLSLDSVVEGYNQQVEIITDLRTKLLQSLVIIDDLLNGSPSCPQTAKDFLSAFKTPAKAVTSEKQEDK